MENCTFIQAPSVILTIITVITGAKQIYDWKGTSCRKFLLEFCISHFMTPVNMLTLTLHLHSNCFLVPFVISTIKSTKIYFHVWQRMLPRLNSTLRIGLNSQNYSYCIFLLESAIFCCK